MSFLQPPADAGPPDVNALEDVALAGQQQVQVLARGFETLNRGRRVDLNRREGVVMQPEDLAAANKLCHLMASSTPIVKLSPMGSAANVSRVDSPISFMSIVSAVSPE